MTDLEFLRGLEWSRRSIARQDSGGGCPWCRAWKPDGHRRGCELARRIQEAEKQAKEET